MYVSLPISSFEETNRGFSTRVVVATSEVEGLFVEGCGRGKWLIDGEFPIVFPKNYSIRVIVESSCWRQVIISHERIIMRTAR